jgi:ABC-type Fe3+/spermidine/putrescine transport system ATPase subunit
MNAPDQRVEETAPVATPSGDAEVERVLDMGQPAIELRGVSKRYGEHLALEPTDLAIGAGEFFCLLGPSGSGKTTLLNLVGGFISQSSCEVHIHGDRVDGLPANRRDVNTVFESYALFPHMTVEENVGFGLRMSAVPKQEAKQRVREALQRVGLDAWARRIPGGLSGGQQQRVAVARALVNRPAVLLLDEPLGALDLKLRRRLQLELAEIHRDVGMTFDYVTHDHEEAMALADRIAVLNQGRIDQVGTPEEIYPAAAVAVRGRLHRRVELHPDPRRRCPAAPRPAARRACAPRRGRPRRRSGLATLMIRPEAIEVIAGLVRDPGLAGRVERVVFLGNHTRVTVACERIAQDIVVALQDAQQVHGRVQFDVGMSIHLKWQPESAVVLTDDEG